MRIDSPPVESGVNTPEGSLFGSANRKLDLAQSASPPSILMFSRRIYPDAVGGREIFVADLVKALSARGFRMRILSESEITWSDSRIRNLGVLRIDLPILGAICFALSSILSASIRRREFDVLHTHSPRLNVTLGFLISKILQKPHVITVHCSTTEDALQDMGTVSAYKAAAAVVAVSPTMIRAVQSQVGPDTRITLIPSGSMLPEAVEDPYTVRRRLGFDNDEVLLVFLGRLSAHKEPGLIIEALELLGREFITTHNVRLLYVGDGPEFKSLLRKRADSSIGDCVSFLGSISHEEVFSVLSACDVFVLPSHHEGLGLAVLEAMFASLSVVLADAEGLRELVEDGKTGRLFPVGDAARLSDVLRGLVLNPTGRKSLGRAGKAGALERFDFRRIVGSHEALYRGVKGPIRRV